jgi:ring-1,2-phenylacetyl-CoA epoxidase subunit PaaE
MALRLARRSTAALLAANHSIISNPIDATHMSSFHSLTVSHVDRETRDSVVLTFAIPSALQTAFAFKQGQYVTLRATIDGADVRRAYSICSEEGGALRVGIKHVTDGAFSSFVHEHIKVGDVIDVMPPEGKFGQLEGRHSLGIAAGSGITPILSIIKTTLEKRMEGHAQSSFTLIYGNRATPSVMFKEELALLKDRYPTRLNLIYIMSREPQDMDIFHGRIDRAKCDLLFDKWLDVSSFDAAFICGPESMMVEAKAALEAKGMATERIKTELFAATKPTAPRKVKPVAVGESNQCEVTVVMDGTTRHFHAVKGSQALLDAGLQAGLDMRFSCKGGVCSTCRAKVTEGEVEMDVNYALEDYEVRRGFVLTCQSYCVTDKVTINFDEET